MNRANQILSVLLGMIFIVSSTGIFVYKTHCSCTGDEQVGIYIKPESCEDNYHVDHSYDHSGIETETNKMCCHECTQKSDDCGCNAPEVIFFKLMDEISNDEISFLISPTQKITVPVLTEIVYLEEPAECTEIIDSYGYPPPKIKSSKKFLIRVNQLKIPFSA